MDPLIKKLISVRPAKRQLDWQKLEFTAFFHYGINSFTDREWGDDSEDISIFNPERLHTDQWCEAVSQAGIRGCIITAKHHDGFCLWDTAYTDHSVMHTPCKKDIVAELSRSCKKYGLKFGIYLSPWDRHEKTYGQGKPYNDYFCSQLTELLTRYGEIYSVWFDGACGEGLNGKKQDYDWDRYYSLIRRLQPNAVISISGPDVRWCGNEAGDCRESEWSVVPAEVFSQSEIAKRSQQSDNEEFRRKLLDEQDMDLGSRKVVGKADDLIWYPAEVDVSIRPGWFHHPSEDGQVRSLENLMDIYINSVGGNSVLLLNIPPHKDGYITEFDACRLKELGDYIRAALGNNLAEGALAESNAGRSSPVNPIENILIDNEDYWQPATEEMPSEITITMKEFCKVSYVVIMEQIRLSQRVERFCIDAADLQGDWKQIFEGTTIGYKKICKLNPVHTNKIRIRILECRSNPAIRFVGVY